MSRDPVSGDPVSRDPVSGDPVSRYPMSRDSVGMALIFYLYSLLNPMYNQLPSHAKEMNYFDNNYKITIC